MGYFGIDSGIAALEDSFGKLREYEVVVRWIYGTGVFHGQVPV